MPHQGIELDVDLGLKLNSDLSLDSWELRLSDHHGETWNLKVQLMIPEVQHLAQEK